MFEGLAIDTLDLTSNKLSEFENFYLEGVKSVKRLYLQSNQLVKIEDDSLTFVNNLTDLYLNYNRLKNAPGTRTVKAHVSVEGQYGFRLFKSQFTFQTKLFFFSFSFCKNSFFNSKRRRILICNFEK